MADNPKTPKLRSTRPDFARARLDELRVVGARIALDDVGTGYSSLSYLRNFPIDVLKVDKSCIDDSPTPDCSRHRPYRRR